MANPALIAQGADRRTKILEFVREHSQIKGYAPNLQEIAEAVGLASPNGVRVHLRTLQDEGFLTVANRSARAIVLTSPAPDGWTR